MRMHSEKSAVVALAVAVLAGFGGAVMAANFVFSRNPNDRSGAQIYIVSTAHYLAGTDCPNGYNVKQGTVTYMVASSAPLVVGSTITLQSLNANACGGKVPGWTYK